MNSPSRQSNYTQSTSFNEEAEKTANFLPIIDQRVQDVTPQNIITSHELPQSNKQQTIKSLTKINKQIANQNVHDIASFSKGQQKLSQLVQYKDLYDGDQQRQANIYLQRDSVLQNDPLTHINQNTYKNSSPLRINHDNVKHKFGYNIYNGNIDYQVNQIQRLNTSYEGDNVNQYKIKQNIYSKNSNNSSLITSNLSKIRSQSCKKKVFDSINICSNDFVNQSYVFTPSSAPIGSLENQFMSRNKPNLEKQSYYNNSIQSYKQLHNNAGIQYSQPNINEYQNSIQNTLDPLKQEIQIHFETEGNQRKQNERIQISINSDNKRDNRFPQGFFIQTPISSKRRTIRLNQNIYKTPSVKKQDSSFNNINEYQYTFGDKDGEQKDSSEFYNNIKQSYKKNPELISQQNALHYQNSVEKNQNERVHYMQFYNSNEKQKDYLNQSITKNDISRQLNTQGSGNHQINPQRQQESNAEDQITFGQFPTRDLNTNSNQSNSQCNQIIHDMQHQSPLAQSVRRYNKPKSLILKKVFDSINSQVDEQKITENSVYQQTDITQCSPSNQINNDLNSLQDKNESHAFHSNQSSPKRKINRPLYAKRQNSPFTLEPLQKTNDKQQKNQISESKNQVRNNSDNPQVSGYAFQTLNSSEINQKDSPENKKEQQSNVNFQKKQSIPVQEETSIQSNKAYQKLDKKQLSMENKQIQYDQDKKNTNILNINDQQQKQVSRKESEEHQQNEQNIQNQLNQPCDRLNIWLQEHSSYKQSSQVEQQQYKVIQCNSMSPTKIVQVNGVSPYENIQQGSINSLPIMTVIDRARLYKNIQPNINNINNGSTKDLQDKSVQFQPYTCNSVLNQQYSLNKNQNFPKKVIKNHIKINSATDLDNQSSQQSYKNMIELSPKQQEKQKIKSSIKKQITIQANEQQKITNNNDFELNNTSILNPLTKQNKDQIQIKEKIKYNNIEQTAENYQSNRVASPKKKDLNAQVLSKRNSQKQEDPESQTKNFGPWADKKEEDNILMEQIIQNQSFQQNI